MATYLSPMAAIVEFKNLFYQQTPVVSILLANNSVHYKIVDNRFFLPVLLYFVRKEILSSYPKHRCNHQLTYINLYTWYYINFCLMRTIYSFLLR
jgi:hypothetical protein